MSTLLRLTSTHGIRKALPFMASKDLFRTVSCRGVSTSPKKDESTTTETEPYKTRKPWVSYGFCEEDKVADRHLMHQTMFVTVTICLVFGVFVVAYLPDPTLKDWSLREAYLQLRHREENGLPAIDPNLIDPSKVILPTDEELGNTDIII